TPPVLAVTDAALLSPLVSMVAFVVSSEKTRRQHGRHSLEVLSNSGISRIGVVLNRVDFKRNKYYYNRLYGYESANYSYGNAQVACPVAQRTYCVARRGNARLVRIRCWSGIPVGFVAVDRRGRIARHACATEIGGFRRDEDARSTLAPVGDSSGVAA